MTEYCKRVLAEFDECAAQLRADLAANLALESPQVANDGGGLSHAAKVHDGVPSMMVSFAWGDTAAEFFLAIHEFSQEHEQHAIKDTLQ